MDARAILDAVSRGDLTALTWDQFLSAVHEIYASAPPEVRVDVRDPEGGKHVCFLEEGSTLDIEC
jgi:hypothetical protein